MKEVADLIERAIKSCDKEITSVSFIGRWGKMEITPQAADREVELKHQVEVVIFFNDKSSFRGQIWKEPIPFTSPMQYNYRIKGSLWEKNPEYQPTPLRYFENPCPTCGLPMKEVVQEGGRGSAKQRIFMVCDRDRYYEER